MCTGPATPGGHQFSWEYSVIDTWVFFEWLVGKISSSSLLLLLLLKALQVAKMLWNHAIIPCCCKNALIMLHKFHNPTMYIVIFIIIAIFINVIIIAIIIMTAFYFGVTSSCRLDIKLHPEALTIQHFPYNSWSMPFESSMWLPLPQSYWIIH